MSKNNTSWNISVSFYKNYLSKPVVVELKTDKKANQKPYKKWLINMAYMPSSSNVTLKLTEVTSKRESVKRLLYR